jgi:hypothetical protein
MTKQGKAIDSLMDENKRLKEINADLLAACELAIERTARPPTRLDMSNETEELFDVVVFDLETRTVCKIVGERMRRDTGHYNAERRLDTIHERLNDDYSAEIVRSGEFKIGDVMP